VARAAAWTHRLGADGRDHADGCGAVAIPRVGKHQVRSLPCSEGPRASIRERDRAIERLLRLRVVPADPIPAPCMTRTTFDTVVVDRRVDVVQDVKVLILIKVQVGVPACACARVR
jgi:hypothetical protein